MKPLVIDLYCGLGGWAEGFLAEGYNVVGFDIERHDYGAGGYPGQLVIQDARTLDGRRFKDAAVIVASPPCQEYSYMAMPWSRAKQIAREYETGVRRRAALTELFDTCFRIQREASEAAGRHIPLVVENVRGAQRWVGQAKANFGSYYLWGDVGMVGQRVVAGNLEVGRFVQPMGRARKTPEGSLDMTRANYNANHAWDDGQKREGRNFHGPERGESSPSFNGGEHETRGVKIPNQGLPLKHPRSISPQWRAKSYLTNAAESQLARGVKGFTPDGQPMKKNVLGRMCGSKSPARKAASAQIAKIPYALASYIARSFYPVGGSLTNLG